MRRAFFAIALASCCAAAAAQAQQPPQLPPGEGRDIVAKACTQCHAFTFQSTLREGPAGWRFHVEDMVLRGAQLSSADVETVVDYLANNFAPGVNLPKAAPVSLPEGDGKALVEQRCVGCHDLGRVGGRFGRNDWDRVVAHMLSIGAPLTPDEAKTVTAYLQTRLPQK